MNIVVLAGGLSGERDVSLTTGTMVTNALRRSGHHAILVDLFFGVETLPENIKDAFLEKGELPAPTVPKTAPDIEAIRASREDSGFGEIGKNVLSLCRAADIVFMGLHGEIGENGKLQAVFDVMGIKYTGSGFLGSTLAMNKGLSKQVFLHHRIKTPRGKLYTQENAHRIPEEFSLPCIVKPCSGGSSIGVTRVTSEDELSSAISAAFEQEDQILVEEFVTGREITCGVLGDTALPPAEVIPKGNFYDYTHKYQSGWITELCPAPVDNAVTEKLAKASLAVFRALSLAVYARMDFILTEKGEVYCLEANTLPGLTPTSHLPQEAKAAGYSYEALCEKIIELSLLKYGTRA